MVMLLCFVLYSIIQAVQLPFFFRLGYEKAKIWTYVPLFGFPAAVFAASSLLDRETWLPVIRNIAVWGAGHQAAVFVIIVAVWAVIMGVSAGLSCRMYRNREF
jgi:ABC-type multidrug transport system permease subunit